MPPQTHRINRQILDIAFGPTDGWVDLQQVAAEVMKHQGMAAMETVFDQLVGPQQQVRLETLELDLGTLQGPDWPQQFSHRLQQCLHHSLQQALRDPTTAPTSPTTATTPEESLFHQLLFFCQQGRLPWWGGKPPAHWLELLQTTLTPTQWQTLATTLQTDPRPLRRLIYTTSDSFLATLVQQWLGLPQAAQVLQLLTPAPWPQSAKAQCREQFWREVITPRTSPGSVEGPQLMAQLLRERQQLSLADSGALDPRDVSETLSRWPTPWRNWLEQILTTPEFSSAAAAEADPTPSQAEPADPQTAASRAQAESDPVVGEERTDQADVSSRDVAGEGAPAAPSAATHPPERVLPGTPESPPSPRSPAVAPSETDEPVYVEAAGMVIVHPFLSELFHRFELLEDGQFCDTASQRRAVALLTYLAFGDIPVAEYEQLLPKLLAAWPWADPLPRYDLTEPERQACDQLLQAVLTHWSALRSSDPDWLREAFFWRDGKLTPVDQGWRLTIENRAQDVLLNRLPWGIGVIRLPWMTDFLHVSWA
jgi:hypothetical protein